MEPSSNFQNFSSPAATNAAFAGHVKHAVASHPLHESASSSSAPSVNVFNQVPSMHSHRFPADNPFIPELTNISNPHVTVTRVEEEAARVADDPKAAETDHIAVIPSYTAWFAMSSIHEIEKRDFPEFLGPAATKASGDYIECRDFMINAYRKDPAEYVSVTSCRRHLSLDVASIIKIHSFLEQWGLINSQIPVGGRPAIVTPVDTRHFKIFAQGPKGLVPVSHPVAGESQVVPSSAAAASAEAIDLNLYPSIMKAEKTAPGPTASLLHYSCHTCGIACEEDRYHCLKVPSMHLCKFCFIEGRFSSAYFSGDFVHINAEAKAEPTVNAWSDQESLYLLEGIEMFGDSWEQVSRHVGTRTREECVAHFLEFPIQDKYLNAQTAPPVPHFNIPFSASENPILSIVSWLASMIHPNVAAVAAQSALKEYEKLAAEPAEPGSLPPASPADFHATPPDPRALEQISNVVLSSATEQAVRVVKSEEHKIQKYVSMLIEAQLKKMELKMQQFEALELSIEAEKLEIEKQKQSLFEERMALSKTMAELQAKEKARQDQELNEAISSVMDQSMLEHHDESLADLMEDATRSEPSPIFTRMPGGHDALGDVKYITEL